MTTTQGTRGRFQPVEELTAGIDSRIHVPDDAESEDSELEGRVKTRFLNLRNARNAGDNTGGTETVEMRRGPKDILEIGSLTIVDGPGRGHAFPIIKHFVQIGRGTGQDIRLTFGDTSISRQCHATVAYYGEHTGFVVRDGLKPNPVLLNGAILKGEESLKHGDLIRVGETTLRFSSN